jgi:hypothetical protein
MTNATLDKFIWTLIYGGLVAVGLGLSVQRIAAALGWGIVAVGGLLALGGVLLIHVRSRRKDDT